jgi:hypothetical protein
MKELSENQKEQIDLTLKKIEVIEATVLNLKASLSDEDTVFAPDEAYDWYDYTQCNCGFLARTLLASDQSQQSMISVDEFVKLAYTLTDGTRTQITGLWAADVSTAEKCSTSGLPVTQVIKALFSAGFTPGEIIQLEREGGETIPEVIDFLDQWKARLTVELDRVSSTIPAKPKSVSSVQSVGVKV